MLTKLIIITMTTHVHKIIFPHAGYHPLELWLVCVSRTPVIPSIKDEMDITKYVYDCGDMDLDKPILFHTPARKLKKNSILNQKHSGCAAALY